MKTMTTFVLKFFVTIVMVVWFVLTACSIDSIIDKGGYGYYIFAAAGVIVPLIVIPKMWKQ